MKFIKPIYWISSALLALMMTFSAYYYLTQPTMEEAFTHLGFPSYFRIELAIAKFAGAVFLLLPAGPRLKEWVYAGFTINFISACIAHIAMGDETFHLVSPLVFLVVLMISYFTLRRLQKQKQVALVE